MSVDLEPYGGQLEFVMDGEPKGKERPRFTRSGHAYTPKATKDAEQAIRDQFKLTYPYYDEVDDGTTAWALRISAHTKSTRRKDLDNIAKLVMDALNGVVWKDDSQIQELNIYRLPAATGSPYTGIEIDLW